MQIADVSGWKEFVSEGKTNGDDDLDPSESLSADPAGNVYSFGILLLEIVSGKVPYSEEQDSLLNSVSWHISQSWLLVARAF